MNEQEQIFARVGGAYDLDLMANSRLVVVGCGGSRSFIEEAARIGLGEIVLIDPDTASMTNIGTQACFMSDVNQPKVDVIANRLRDINPNVVVQTRQARFEDIQLADLELLLKGAWAGRAAPRQTLLALKTDNFEAQAHGNRVALHFGIPAIAAQVYQNGFGGEITFTHPDTTPACQRCALESRYSAYLQGYKNQVTSHATPIYATSRINSLCGLVMLTILHHGSDHPRWKGMLEKIGNRNLVQMKLWPDFNMPVFDRVFGGAQQECLFFDNTVWLAQQPDHPESNGFPACPDCGGVGNLNHALNSFHNDLYTMRTSPVPTETQQES